MHSDPKHASNSWSEALRQQTRDAIECMQITPDGCLHFKHASLGFATILMDDLCQSRLLLKADTAKSTQLFDDVTGLLQAGWVID